MKTIVSIIITILALSLINAILIIPFGKYIIANYAMSLGLMYFQMSGIIIMILAKIGLTLFNE